MDGEVVTGLLERLDHGSVRAAVSEVEAQPVAPDEAVVVRVIRGWGRIGAGETGNAQAILRPIVEALEVEGEPRVRAHALTALGVACILGGEGEAGSALLERALPLHRVPWPRAQCQRFLALALEQRGAWEGAAGRYAAAAEAYAGIPDDFGQGSALYGAAAAYIELGQESLARTRLDEAVEALRRAGPLPALGSALGLQATFTDDEEAAGALLAESERLTAGTPWMYRSDWLLRAGEVALRFGHPERALALAQDALAVTVPTATEHTWAEHAAAAALAALGREDEAAQLLDAAPGGEISGAGRLERLSLRLGIAARVRDARTAERALDALERLGRARHRRRGVPARLASAAEVLAETNPEAAARAARLALTTGHPDAEVRPLLVRLRDGGVRIPLGPLWLESPVGSGGMGQVWRARHPDGHALAIKLLHAGRAGEDVDLFEAEIAAVARLDHPNIVRVYAALRVDAAAAPMVDRPVGSPALVMELVEGGTLADRSDAWGWPETRAVLAQLLDALAHAHARGVLHLDLKPGNVLLDRSGRVPVPRLTDFGMAGIVQRTGEGQLFGTPAYLPPEQADGRRLGPPSDLYGLGCLAWHLLTGQPVYGNVPAIVHIARHASGVLPRFEPLHPVPEGTEEWLRMLLAHHPEDRFPSAADAAAALGALGSAPLVRAPPRVASTAAPTLDLAQITGPVRSFAATPARSPMRSWRPAPWRPDWRVPLHGPAAPFLRGLGEGLLEARAGRRVGRAEERDRLWRILGEVHRDGVSRCAWVVGADGLGRSALLRWLGEAAVETGAAWLLAVGDRDHARIETALRTTRKDRPTLVLIDDADDPEGQRLAASIQRPGVLVVGASRRPPTELGPTLLLALHPLPAAAIGELLDNRLPLDRALAARIASRAAGSPGFALALLSDLVRRDVLEPGPEGFRPIDGAELPLPEDLDALWAARLDTIAPPGSPQRSALEVAAVLGHEPSDDLWRRACARAELPADAATLALAETLGWIEAVGDCVRFRLPAAREALLAGAVRSGRAPIWHGAAADALLVDGAIPEAAGRHLALAGRHADALRPLRAAAATAINATRIDECRELLELWDGSADALGLAPDDVRRASPLVVRVHLALHTDADPYPLLARAGALAAGKDPGLESQITYSHAWVLARDGRHVEAEERYRVAIALAVQAGMDEMHAVAHLGLATSVYALGRDATALLEPARRLPAERAPMLPMRVDACAGRGLLRLGRLADARPHLDAALAAARARGASDVEAEVAADLADAAAIDGDMGGMLRHLHDAVTALLPTGSDKLLGAQVRLAGGLVCARRDDEARALLEPLGARFGRRLKPAVVAEHALVEVALGDRPVGDLARNRERVDPAEPAVVRLLAELERRAQKR